MFVLKMFIFMFIILSVKVMFTLFYQEEDNKIYKMKEVIDFADYLRIYSCSMKMNINEIIEKYSFKYSDVKSIFTKILTEYTEDNEIANNQELLNFIRQKMSLPREFNIIICQIKDYYGTTMSDTLNMKLMQTKNEMDKFYSVFEGEYKERKNLINKLSLLVGCLIAIVLI